MTNCDTVAIRDPNARDPYPTRSCLCGYRIDDGCGQVFYSLNQIDRRHDCSVVKALRNHITFPSFELLYDITDPTESLEIYFKPERVEPLRHFAFLIQVARDISLMRPGIFGYSQFGEPVKVYFYHDKGNTPKTFSWSDFQKLGSTLVILYPVRKTFTDGQIGIRQENLNSCFIFKSNIHNLESEAQKLLDSKDAKFTNKNTQCFNCSVEKETLLRCSKCKLALYCSTECQKKSWATHHKSLCSQFDILLRLAVLPRIEQFQKEFNFDRNDSNCFLSDYIFSEKFVNTS
ncbi:unnamed protein product [Brachionus calyciflorus]|uniref:MYND-type domain-containing protein n=1 Tax=Brachionus calyciflorus TaxID=104777 RepID=A0A813SUP4_9BILA|nr:unnamed protein product [Brachionus calyciflorus]